MLINMLLNTVNTNQIHEFSWYLGKKVENSAKMVQGGGQAVARRPYDT